MSSARSPSALRRGSSAAGRDSDQTDPSAALLDPGIEAEDDLLVVGPNDATQVFDAQAAAAALQAPAAPTFKLVALAGPKAGSEFTLGRDEIVVGRSSDVGISIPDVSVSRRHASFALQPDGTYLINDLGSGNGTKINGNRVTNGIVRHGDEIAVGDTVLQFIETGAPLPGKGRKKPKKASGEFADDSASTRHNNAQVAPRKPAAPTPRSNRQRKPLYIVAGVTIGLLLLLAVFAKLRTPSRQERTVATAGADAGAIFREAKGLAFNHQWIEAVRKAEDALEQAGQDGTIESFLEQARVEAKHQKQVADAKEALAANDFATARALLEQVPRAADVFPQARAVREQIVANIEATLAEARALVATDKERATTLVAQVLEVEPDNTVALELKEELETPERPEPVARPKRVARPRPSRPEPRARPRITITPAQEAFIGGDVQRAMRLAEEGGDAESGELQKKLRAFDANFRQGMQLAQQERAAEAVKTLGQAARLARDISGGKSSKPGAQVKVQLANMEYLLGIYCKGDEGLPCAARHFRAALKAQPDHSLAKKQLSKVEGRAREIYTEAYVMKGNSPDRALKLFKIARDSLLPSDETHQKAGRWYENLGGS